MNGEPDVNLRPLQPQEVQTFEERLEEMRQRGEILPAHTSHREFLAQWKPSTKARPGALQRFLKNR